MADDESWEDIDEEEIVRRVIDRQEQLTKDVQGNPGKDHNPTATAVYNVVNEIGPTTIQYSSDESAYVASVKILKRPELAKESLENAHQPMQQKSLAEREADYASARARIMGQTEHSNTRLKHRQSPVVDPSQQRHNRKELDQRPTARKQ